MSSSSRRYDVVVVGGGPSGIGAAVAAGRLNDAVALVERHDVLGGTGTAALINDFCKSYWDGERFVIDGVFGELRRRLIDRRALYVTKGPDARSPNDRHGIEQYDHEALAEVAREMVAEAGVALHLETRLTGGAFPPDGPARLRVANALADANGGGDRDRDEWTLEAAVVVDATGDATVAHRAGVPTHMGRASDGAVQPLTYGYVYGPVDVDRLRAEIPDAVMYDENVGEHFVTLGLSEEVSDRVQRGLRSGDIDLPVPKLYESISVPGDPEYLTINFNHVEVDDPTDPGQLAEAEAEGRRQMREAMSFLRTLPGFEDAEVVEEARQIGVRESRQIEGLYTLTVEDEFDCRQFDDVIAQCCAPIDVHVAAIEDDASPHLPDGEHYDVPWRTLVPREGPSNLVVAGRSISATSEAMSSFRMQPSVMAIGEAAGVTAALAAARGVAVADVDVAEVQDRLEENGAVLE
jgi:hypothetical protein